MNASQGKVENSAKGGERGIKGGELQVPSGAYFSVSDAKVKGSP
jgi:hypothetical protein